MSGALVLEPTDSILDRGIMFFTTTSKTLARHAAALLCGIGLAAAGQPTGADASTASESSLPVVRVDLQAGAFLDPLPFDQAFLIAGKIPAPTEAIEVRIGEYRDAPETADDQDLGKVIRWNRLDQVAGATQSKGASEAKPLESWNRLERIRAMQGAPDANLFSDAGSAQAGNKDAGWQTFRMLIQPLEAQRYYHFDFALERKLVGREVDAFVAAARGQAGRLLQGSGRSLTMSDGERLRSLLIASLHRVVDADRLKVGAIFDADLSYASVHDELSRLAADWRGADDEGADDALTAGLEALARRQSVTLRTSMGASTVDNDYVSADVGMLYAPSIGARSAYVGANFYLRPVNKSVPLRLKGGHMRRFAVTVGVSLNSIEDRRGIRSDLYYNSTLVLGAGYRISQYWRIGAGGLLFRERDPDSYPLTNKKRTALTPYVALSFDADVGHQLRGIGGLFDFLKGDR